MVSPAERVGVLLADDRAAKDTTLRPSLQAQTSRRANSRDAFVRSAFSGSDSAFADEFWEHPANRASAQSDNLQEDVGLSVQGAGKVPRSLSGCRIGCERRGGS